MGQPLLSRCRVVCWRSAKAVPPPGRGEGEGGVEGGGGWRYPHLGTQLLAVLSEARDG